MCNLTSDYFGIPGGISSSTHGLWCTWTASWTVEECFGLVRVNTFVWLDLFEGLDQRGLSCIACKYSQYSHVFFTRWRPPSIGNKRYAQQQFALDWDLCPGAVWWDDDICTLSMVDTQVFQVVLLGLAYFEYQPQHDDIYFLEWCCSWIHCRRSCLPGGLILNLKSVLRAPTSWVLFPECWLFSGPRVPEICA